MSRKIPSVALPTCKSTNPSTDSKKKVAEICDDAVQRALWLVLNEFPVKIKQIEKLREEFKWDNIMTIESDVQWIRRFVDSLGTGTSMTKAKRDQSNKAKCCILNSTNKPLLFECLPTLNSEKRTMIDTNTHVHQMISRIRPFVIEFTNLTHQIAFGVSNLEPKLQSGNNFGVEVQNRALVRIVELCNNNIGNLYLLCLGS